MIKFKDIKVDPKVQEMIDRGVDPINVVVSAAEGHTVAEVEAETLSLPGVSQSALTKTDN